MSIAVGFGMATTDKYREQHQEYVCPVNDGRQKTVAFVSDAPEWLLDRAQVEAASSRDERTSDGGRVELIDTEKDRLGPFTGDNNLMEGSCRQRRHAGVDVRSRRNIDSIEST